MIQVITAAECRDFSEKSNPLITKKLNEIYSTCERFAKEHRDEVCIDVRELHEEQIQQIIIHLVDFGRFKVTRKESPHWDDLVISWKK